MKNFSILVLLALIICACQQDTAQTQSNLSETVEPAPQEEKVVLSLQECIVDAKSGLNYRDAPKGKVLGKFEDGTQLSVVAYTGVFDEVMDEQKALYGEWLGVMLGDSTVYVFEPFLIPIEPPSDKAMGNTDTPEKSYVFSPYYLETYSTKEKSYFPYVPLTDSYQFNDHPDSLTIAPEYLGNNEFEEYHYLKGKYRDRFIKNMRLQESDKVYIYNYALNKLYQYPVKDLPIIAHINVYGSNKPVPQYDYVIGLSLEQKWLKLEQTDLSYTFVYVGKENPFVRGSLQPMLWDKIDQEGFPNLEIDSLSAARLASYTINSTYKFTQDKLVYYLRYSKKDNFVGAIHMIVRSPEKVLFNKVMFSSEGTSFAGIQLKDPSNQGYSGQWTGKLFKNGPIVMFGFWDTSFGCPWIYKLDGSGDYFSIACDNRH